jgi:hypothetical protein
VCWLWLPRCELQQCTYSPPPTNTCTCRSDRLPGPPILREMAEVPDTSTTLRRDLYAPTTTVVVHACTCARYTAECRYQTVVAARLDNRPLIVNCIAYWSMSNTMPVNTRYAELTSILNLDVFGHVFVVVAVTVVSVLASMYPSPSGVNHSKPVIDCTT